MTFVQSLTNFPLKFLDRTKYQISSNHIAINISFVQFVSICKIKMILNVDFPIKNGCQCNGNSRFSSLSRYQLQHNYMAIFFTESNPRGLSSGRGRDKKKDTNVNDNQKKSLV